MCLDSNFLHPTVRLGALRALRRETECRNSRPQRLTGEADIVERVMDKRLAFFPSPAYGGFVRKITSAQMEPTHRHTARPLQATRRESHEQHDEEQLPNGVLVKNSTTVGPAVIRLDHAKLRQVSVERPMGYEETQIGVQTVVISRQALWATSLWLVYAGGTWTISKTEIKAVF